MVNTLMFDFARVILFPKDGTYKEELNKLHSSLSSNTEYHFLDNFYFDEDLLSYLHLLKDRFVLYLYTSGTIQETHECVQKLDGLFDEVFSAERLHLPKKLPTSYVTLAQKIGRDPAEILFVDDSRTNTAAAQVAGLRTVTYQSITDLKDAVHALSS